jgi:predicted RNase H-like nuclease (RuvC/YqgF family)
VFLTIEVYSVTGDVHDMKMSIQKIEKDHETYTIHLNNVKTTTNRLSEEHGKLRDNLVDMNLHVHLIEQNIELSKQINTNIHTSFDKKIESLLKDFRDHFSSDDSFRKKTILTLMTLLGTVVVGFLGLFLTLLTIT